VTISVSLKIPRTLELASPTGTHSEPFQLSSVKRLAAEEPFQ
jgi:hypothetical protein